MVAYLSIKTISATHARIFAATARRCATAEVQAALGGVQQIFNHGINRRRLVLLRRLLEQRRGLRGLGDFGGLMQRHAVLCGWMSVAMFSVLRLAGLKRIHRRVSSSKAPSLLRLPSPPSQFSVCFLPPLCSCGHAGAFQRSFGGSCTVWRIAAGREVGDHSRHPDHVRDRLAPQFLFGSSTQPSCR